MARRQVLVIGELNPDLIITGLSAEAPALGTEQTYLDETLTLGSSSAITCVLVQRLGLSTAFASVIGADDHGRYCIETLETEGVDCALLVRDPSQSTGITMSLAYPRDRLLLTRLGSMETVSGALLDGVDFSTVGHLHTGSLFLLNRLRADLPALFARARASGCTLSVDPGWDPSGTWDRTALRAILPLTDVFLPNRAEALAMTGANNVDRALATLRNWGARRVAIKLGAEGGAVATAQGVLHQQGFPAQVVDTTGAGDAFNAGFLRGLRAGWADADCLRLAVACGAVAVGAPGGTGGLRGIEQARAVIAAAGEALPDV